MIFQGKDSAGNQPKAWGAVIDSLSKKNKFTWDKSFVDCKNITMDPIKSKDEVRTFSFTIKIKPTSPIDAKHGETVLFTIPTDDISLILRFRTILGSGWQLYDIEAASAIKVTGTWQAEIKKGAHAANFSVDGLAIGTYNGYSYACGTTKAARFATDEGKNEYKLGVFFNNLQVQPFGYYVDDKKQVHFSRNTTDCVGTFTHGSFMGIIVALVLATVLLFGFLMLNSVQTVDRFDDPKQKQLVINAKE
ncbi:hypothetical protein M3Y97_00688900 [Aphelenchoides bicaudatus]|nr:hypothetical protein M3Y97_00688900 [Aphelenchoides bicaudatus]